MKKPILLITKQEFLSEAMNGWNLLGSKNGQKDQEFTTGEYWRDAKNNPTHNRAEVCSACAIGAVAYAMGKHYVDVLVSLPDYIGSEIMAINDSSFNKNIVLKKINNLEWNY